MNLCKIEGCEKTSRTRGWCAMHYTRWWRHGDPNKLNTQQAAGCICKIEGCGKAVESRGWCKMHYSRSINHSDLLVAQRRANGEGTPDKGYWRISKDGRRLGEHVLVAEKALGKSLPKGVIVHHVDESKANNKNNNLVICPSAAYHALIHQRMRALEASGNASYRKCSFCKKHDDPDEMYENKRKNGSIFHHRECHTLHYKQKRKSRDLSAIA